MCLCGDYGCSNCDPSFYDNDAAQESGTQAAQTTNSQSDAICPHFKVEKYLGSDGWIEVNKCIVAGKLTHI